MRGGYRTVWVALLGAALLGGCTLANSIDVCDRVPSPEQEINARTEGSQFINSPRAIVPMPFGGALAVFSSAATSAPNERRFEIRETLLAVDGSPLPTCEETNEHTIASTSATLGELDLRMQPWAVPPRTDDGAGVIVYGGASEESSQVWAEVISGDGCSFALEPTPIQVSLEEGPTCEIARTETPPVPFPESRCVQDPSAVSLGSNDRGEFDFAVLWTSLYVSTTSVSSQVRGRVLRARFGGHEFLSVQDTLNDEPVVLVVGEVVTAMTAISLSDTRFALIWQSNEPTSWVTRWRIFDEQLNPVGPAIALGESPGDPPDAVRVSAASNGRLVAVTWTGRDEMERARAYGRYLTLAGEPQGDAFELAPTDGSQEEAAVTALPDDAGFLFAWGATGDGSHMDTSGTGIRAAAFGTDRQPRFLNAACGRGDFQLNTAFEDRQRRPALASLSDGTVFGMWTDDGSNGNDVSRSSVRGIVFRARDLLPIE